MPRLTSPGKRRSSAQVHIGAAAAPVAEFTRPFVRMAIRASHHPMSARCWSFRLDMAPPSWLLGVDHCSDRSPAQPSNSVNEDAPSGRRNCVRRPAHQFVSGRVTEHVGHDRHDRSTGCSAADAHRDQLHGLCCGNDAAGHRLVGFWASAIVGSPSRSAGCDTCRLCPCPDARIHGVVRVSPFLRASPGRAKGVSKGIKVSLPALLPAALRGCPRSLQRGEYLAFA